LFADEGSKVITDLGLLDRDLEAHHAAFGMPTAEHQRGVAYPAVFLLDADGRVAQKRIQPNYRAREGGPLLLEEALAMELVPGGAWRDVAQPSVRLRLVADGSGYVRWQRTRLRVELAADADWHVYAHPVPAGYTGLTIEVDAEPDVEVGEPAFPESHEFSVAGLDEKFLVYEGNISVPVPIAFNVGKDLGPITVRVRVSYQACNETVCLPPATVTLEITLPEITVS
jgi:hypothetical protein